MLLTWFSVTLFVPPFMSLLYLKEMLLIHCLSCRQKVEWHFQLTGAVTMDNSLFVDVTWFSLLEVYHHRAASVIVVSCCNGDSDAVLSEFTTSHPARQRSSKSVRYSDLIFINFRLIESTVNEKFPRDCSRIPIENSCVLAVPQFSLPISGGQAKV